MQVPQKLSSIFKFEQNYKTRAKILSEGSFLTVVFFLQYLNLKRHAQHYFLKSRPRFLEGWIALSTG